MNRRDTLVPYQMLWPAVFLESALVLAPLVIGFWYSLHNVRFFQIRSFTGLDNYETVVTSPEVVSSLIVTAVFSLTSLVLTFVTAVQRFVKVWKQADVAPVTAAKIEMRRSRRQSRRGVRTERRRTRISRAGRIGRPGRDT